MSGPMISRRSALLGPLSVCGCAGELHAQTPSNLTASPAVALTPAEEERHSIFLQLAMALLFEAWGVDRDSAAQIAAYARVAPGRQFADYLGHNIGALLVNQDSGIVCFALNRSVALNSTMAHAEARAVGTAIAFANDEHKSTKPPWTFSTLLQGYRIYGTLEPCAQCVGIMDLANIGGVIYAQDDPGQRNVANVLYNLYRNLHSQPSLPGAPLPLRATFLPFWDVLAAAYRRFLDAVPPGSRTGLTSFLQTVEAYQVYAMAARAFATLQTTHSENAAILREAQEFRARWADKLHNNELGIIPGPLAPNQCRIAEQGVTDPTGPLGIPTCNRPQ